MTETLAESLARRLREVDPYVRSAIRVEAMRECERVAVKVSIEWRHIRDESTGNAVFDVATGIRALIAKEQSNG